MFIVAPHFIVFDLSRAPKRKYFTQEVFSGRPNVYVDLKRFSNYRDSTANENVC